MLRHSKQKRLLHLAHPFQRYLFNSAIQSNSGVKAQRFFASPSLPQPPNHVIFSGIQPTGIPHLGNYLGALQQWVKLQDDATSETKLLFSVVDLHAITVPQKAERLRQCKRETLATFLAIGLDPARSILFYQSSVYLSSFAHSRMVYSENMTHK